MDRPFSLITLVGLMSAGLLVEQNRTAAACPRLSANGKPIGALRKADRLPCKPGENYRWAAGAHFRKLPKGTLPGNTLYFKSAREIYPRPCAVTIDTYC